MKWLRRSASDPAAPRRPTFARVASAVLWSLAVVFAVGAVQVGRALFSNRIWINYRGELVAQADMRRELGFFLVATLLCALLGWYWRRVQR